LVDWEQKADVRAKLRLAVKKLLIKYGYPPDVARIEADKVLVQGEALAKRFVQGLNVSVINKISCIVSMIFSILF